MPFGVQSDRGNRCWGIRRLAVAAIVGMLTAIIPFAALGEHRFVGNGEHFSINSHDPAVDRDLPTVYPAPELTADSSPASPEYPAKEYYETRPGLKSAVSDDLVEPIGAWFTFGVGTMLRTMPTGNLSVTLVIDQWLLRASLDYGFPTSDSSSFLAPGFLAGWRMHRSPIRLAILVGTKVVYPSGEDDYLPGLAFDFEFAFRLSWFGVGLRPELFFIPGWSSTGGLMLVVDLGFLGFR